MMGKRKRSADNNNNKTPPPSDLIPQVDMQLERRSSNQAEFTSATQSLVPSNMNVMGSSSSVKRGDQSHGSSRALLMRQPRHSFGRQYSRRTNHSDHIHASSSPSYLKGGSFMHDAKMSFKLPHKDSYKVSESSRDRTFYKPERTIIRSNSFASQNVREMECGICGKRLRKSPVILENSMISSNDHSVVAILVCGHAYHADCLEQKTSYQDRQDPPCPLCFPSPM